MLATDVDRWAGVESNGRRDITISKDKGKRALDARGGMRGVGGRCKVEKGADGGAKRGGQEKKKKKGGRKEVEQSCKRGGEHRDGGRR